MDARLNSAKLTKLTHSPPSAAFAAFPGILARTRGLAAFAPFPGVFACARAPARTCRCQLWQLPLFAGPLAQHCHAGLDPAPAFFSTARKAGPGSSPG